MRGLCVWVATTQTTQHYILVVSKEDRKPKTRTFYPFDRIFKTESSKGRPAYKSYGLAIGIMPWNVGQDKEVMASLRSRTAEADMVVHNCSFGRYPKQDGTERTC